MRGEDRHKSKNLETAQFLLIKKVIKNYEVIKVGHVWINDETVSWTNSYDESKSVPSVPKRKEGGVGMASRHRRRLSRAECGQF